MKNFFNAISKRFASDPNKPGNDGLTPLQRAILLNDHDKAEKLISQGADCNDRGLLNFPPLHLALLKDRGVIASLLISGGADVTLADVPGRTPLHIAVMQAQEYLALLIMKGGADVNAKDDDGNAPLHVVSSAKPGMIAYLLEYGADINVKDSNGNTPLHLMLDRPDMAAALLSHGANVNIENRRRISPFRLFINDDRLMQDRYLTNLMLENGPDMKVTNHDGETMAMAAVRLKLEPRLRFLLTCCNMDARDDKGRNILHKALRVHNYTALPLLLKEAPRLIRQKNDQGLTPLQDYLGLSFDFRFMQSYDSFAKTVKTLITHGDDINARDAQGRSLAHIAVSMGGDTDFLEYLVTQKANLDFRDRDGKAPIHKVIARKDMDMLDVLLDAGADPDQVDNRGWTLLDHLAKNNDRNSPIVQRLIVAGGQYNKQLPLNPEEIRKTAFFKKPGAGPKS